MGTISRVAGAAALALLAMMPAAHADAIDGNWCHVDGRRLSIQGPQIVTPGGARLAGTYSRHYFSYVVPATELPAGQTIGMTLLDENTVQVRAGTQADATPEVWKRCAPSIS